MHDDNAELASQRDASSNTILAGTNGNGRGIEQSRGGQCRQIYESGAILYHESERYKGLFQLARGRVKLSISSSSGRAAIMKFARQGSFWD